MKLVLLATHHPPMKPVHETNISIQTFLNARASLCYITPIWNLYIIKSLLPAKGAHCSFFSVLSLPLRNQIPRPPKRMRLGIKHPLVQTNNIRLTEHQIEILQRLRRPEALHAIILLRRDLRHVNERRVSELRSGAAFDGFEHCPGAVEEALVAGDAVEEEEGLDGFGTEVVFGVRDGFDAGDVGERVCFLTKG
jgi:hypothetical protein